MLCARMPYDRSPSVRMLPVLRTVTLLPVLPRAAGAAETEPKPTTRADRTGDAEPAGTAAAAHALRHDRVRVVTDSGDIARAVHINSTARAGDSARPAETQRRRKTTKAHRRRNTESAVAATATHALGQNAVGPVTVRLKRPRTGDRHVARAAAGAAFAADAQRQAGSFAAGDRDAEPTGSSATANALRENGMRIRAVRGNGTAALHNNVARGATAPPPPPMPMAAEKPVPIEPANAKPPLPPPPPTLCAMMPYALFPAVTIVPVALFTAT